MSARFTQGVRLQRFGKLTEHIGASLNVQSAVLHGEIVCLDDAPQHLSTSIWLREENAPHILVQPVQRCASQQIAVDWFAFWLQGYEEPDRNPAKAGHYARWRELRKRAKKERQQSGKRFFPATTLARPLNMVRRAAPKEIGIVDAGRRPKFLSI